jgi:hypothetical protein
MPGVSVYGTKTEQDTVYETVQQSPILVPALNERNLTIVRESISPIYVASLYEYAKTGVFTIKPHQGGTKGDAIYYMAKIVTADGAYAGNTLFYIENGIAHPQIYYSENLSGSNSYADHAERVQTLTGRESFVPASEVRLVGVEGLATVFYVNDGKTEALVYIDGMNGLFPHGQGEIVYVGKELKEIADEKLAELEGHMSRVAEWEAANPGKAWSYTGSGGAAAASGISGEVNDVVNIVEYLGIEDTDAYFTSTAVTVASATPNIARDVKKSVESNKKRGPASSMTIGYGPPPKETFTPPTTIAIPIAAFVLYIGIKLIFISKKRKIKKTEITDSQSNDN